MKFLGTKEHVVILGAGYGGLSCALELSRSSRISRQDRSTRITLVNQEPRQELLCELFRCLRTGKAEYFDFRTLIQRNEIRFIEAQALDIHPHKKVLTLKGPSPLSYDTLVIATGHKFFLPKIEGLSDFFNPQAQEDRKVLLFRNNTQAQNLRLALRKLGWQQNRGIQEKKELFVVVLGAGATGLEVAGEIAAMRGKNQWARVILVDQKEGLLEGFSPIATKILKKELSRMQIESVLGSPVIKVKEREVHIQNGQVIPWDLLVLCTGSQAHTKLYQNFEGSYEESSGLIVRGNCELSKFSSHFAVGDIARILLDEHPLLNQPLVSKRASLAIQEGRFVAREIATRLKQSTFHRHPRVFAPKDYGYLISLGPYNGIARLGEEISSKPLRLFSPFILGPAVDELKRLAKLKYLSQLKWGFPPELNVDRWLSASTLFS